MGKKSKFITKENSQKFHLLHRSQTDAAYAGEEVPSEFVLVAANETNTNSRKKRVAFGDNNDGSTKRFQDHITKEGFANDGYDYTQHLKEMGGGRYIGRDGKAVDMDFSYNKERNFELPEDALPSAEGELERDLEAITISHELMDEDIRAALFEDGDEDGEFEELQDDFLTSVMEAPEDHTFDYEAHIANLLARSEEKLGINHARGWENGAKPIRIGKKHVDFGEYGDEEFEDDEYEEFEDPLEGITDEERQRIEIQFDRTLDEYGDEEIGELDDEEDGMLGEIELDGDNELFNNMLDEFIQDQKDLVYAEGTLVRKGTRSTVLIRDGQDAQTVIDGVIQEIESAPVDVKKETAEQIAAQEESKQYLDDLLASGKTHQEIESCQQYLKETREVEKWDCESILSTYSTLDNHPSMIKETNSRFRKYKSHHERSLDQAAAMSRESAFLNGVKSAVTRIVQPKNAPTPQIILSGKLGLPEGYGRNDIKISSSQSVVSKMSTIKSKPQTIKEEVDEAQESDNTEGENDEDDDEQSESESNFKDKKDKGKKKETPEEKKLRKQAVKQENKAKRVSKKELKNAYKQEGNRMNNCAAKEQSTDHCLQYRTKKGITLNWKPTTLNSSHSLQKAFKHNKRTNSLRFCTKMDAPIHLRVNSTEAISEKHALKSLKRFLSKHESGENKLPEEISDKLAIILSEISSHSTIKAESETPKVKRKREKSEGVEDSGKKKSKKSKQ